MPFQHYDARRLWGDIRTALGADIRSLNIATPPISNADLAAEVFGRDIRNQVPPGEPSPFARMYTRNMTTRHAALFGGSGPYIGSVADEIDGLRAYAASIAA
jgi:hypothetical protein